MCIVTLWDGRGWQRVLLSLAMKPFSLMQNDCLVITLLYHVRCGLTSPGERVTKLLEAFHGPWVSF